MVPFPVTLYNL